MGKETKTNKGSLTLVTDAPPDAEEIETEETEADATEIEAVAPWSTWLDGNRQTLKALHSDMQFLIKGVPSAGLNWQPGANTNSLWALTLHTLGTTLHLLATAADIAPRWQEWQRATELAASGDDPGLLLRAIRNMDDFLDKVFSVLEEESPEMERDWLGKPKPISYLVAHAVEHAGRHVGHMELTRQLWDQRSKRGR
ncbi:MAG: DUF664 domain-containing protein [Thermomicrobia bacterium]|nr:DUF664 domain-containing protein [Thermomicrobia bacterium]